MNYLAFVLAVLLGLFSSAPHAAQAQMLDANAWNVTEDGGWTAVWTFDRDHKYLNGEWHNNQTGERVRVGGMSVHREGRQIVINRPGLGNYVGTLSGDGRSMSGTLSWSSGRFSAAVFNGSGGFIPDGGGAHAGAALLDAQSWNVTEDGGWTAVWTFNGRNSMSGVWTNGGTGDRARASGMSVTRSGNQIIINRPGLGNYVGTLSGDGRSISGTLSWSSGHFTASVRS